MRNLYYSNVNVVYSYNRRYLYIHVQYKYRNSAAIRNKTFLHILILHNWTGNTEEIWLPEARGI